MEYENIDINFKAIGKNHGIAIVITIRSVEHNIQNENPFIISIKYFEFSVLIRNNVVKKRRIPRFQMYRNHH